MRRVLLLLSLLLACSAFGADMPKPELYVIHEEVVRPSAIAAYESAARDFLATLAEKKVSSPALTFNTYMTNDLHYIYIVRIPNFAALDMSQSEWEKAKAMVGVDRWTDLERRGNEPMVSYSEIVTVRRPDLSYAPANPRLKQEEQRYARLDFYYLMPGKEKEAEAVAHDYIALFKAKNITEPYSIYTSVFGDDLPLWVVAVPAKSEADFVAADERVNSTLGADVRPLQQRALAVSRRIEHRSVNYRPDLSYQGAPAATK